MSGGCCSSQYMAAVVVMFSVVVFALGAAVAWFGRKS